MPFPPRVNLVITPELKVLITAVRKYASEHYEEEGWDYIVEAFTDEEVAEELLQDRCDTVLEAIESLRWTANLLDERRADVRAEIF